MLSFGNIVNSLYWKFSKKKNPSRNQDRISEAIIKLFNYFPLYLYFDYLESFLSFRPESRLERS